MKFKQVEIGQKFNHKGSVYTKIGPFKALAEGAANPIMLIQAAVVELHGGAGEVAQGKIKAAPYGALRSAVETYHLACLELSADRGIGVDDLKSRLQGAYQKMLRSIPR